MDFKLICKKKFNFSLWVYLSGPLENVEIYFSKIDIEIFAIDTIFSCDSSSICPHVGRSVGLSVGLSVVNNEFQEVFQSY